MRLLSDRARGVALRRPVGYESSVRAPPWLIVAAGIGGLIAGAAAVQPRQSGAPLPEPLIVVPIDDIASTTSTTAPTTPSTTATSPPTTPPPTAVRPPDDDGDDDGDDDDVGDDADDVTSGSGPIVDPDDDDPDDDGPDDDEPDDDADDDDGVDD
jgi:hypothetical protein